MIYDRTAKRQREREINEIARQLQDEERKLIYGDSNGTYGERITAKVREKYQLSDELAILRQRTTKPTEYKEYSDYVEKCKKEVKETMN